MEEEKKVEGLRGRETSGCVRWFHLKRENGLGPVTWRFALPAPGPTITFHRVYIQDLVVVISW